VVVVIGENLESSYL